MENMIRREHELVPGLLMIAVTVAVLLTLLLRMSDWVCFRPAGATAATAICARECAQTADILARR